MFKIRNLTKKYIISIKATAVFSCLLLIAVFGLFNVFYSMSQYDKQLAFVHTLRTNNDYVMQITKYSESAERYMMGEEEVFVGTQIWYETVLEHDADALKQTYGDAANFYPSYYINKTFSDFSNVQLGDKISLERKHLIRYDPVELYAYSFRDAIVVEDFNTFNNTVLYGAFPEQANEVLVYDYLVDSLIHFNAIACQSTKDAVGLVLKDKDTGFSMKISGIVESDYKSVLRENELWNTKRNYAFTYLSSLQSVFCNRAFIEENLIQENEYISVVNSVFMVIDDDSMILKEVHYDRAKIEQCNLVVSDLNDAVIDPEIAALNWRAGAIISKAQLSQILGVDMASKSNNEILSDMRTVKLDVDWMMYDRSLEHTLLANNVLNILAVVDYDIPYVLITNYDNTDNNFLFLNNYNSNFRSIYLSLSSNWANNAALLNDFVFPTHTKDFYLNNPEYYVEGWCSYNSYDVLIGDADYYLNAVKDVAKDILLYVSIAAIIGLLMLSFNSIKYNSYKIGVFKSLGYSNFRISIIFVFQIFAIALVSFIVSIPVAKLVLSRINHNFVKDIHAALSFFSVTGGAIGMTALLTLVAVIFTFVSLIKLYIAPPVKIIKNNKQ